MRHSKKLTAGLGIITAGLLSTGVAFAAWTSSGSGSGVAQSTTSENSTIVTATSAADLYPGANETITVTINNTNDYPVVVTSISAGTSDALATPTCLAGTVTSGAETFDDDGIEKVGGGTQILANSSATYELTTHMAGDASDGCKSRNFNLPLTATLRSDAA